jgi:transcriptional regulatory protein LevR
MKINKEYIYSFSNASFTLRVIKHLRNQYQPYLDSVAVINQIDRWIVKVCLKNFIPAGLAENLQAFLNEMGLSAQPSLKVIQALDRLEAGESPTTVMNRYQVVVVVHGKPEAQEIEIFRDQIVNRLGYCPQNMA